MARVDANISLVGVREVRPETKVTYDERSWPFVVVTMPARLTTDAEVDANFRNMAAYGERGVPFGFVLDTRGTPDPDARRRRHIADF